VNIFREWVTSSGPHQPTPPWSWSSPAVGVGQTVTRSIPDSEIAALRCGSDKCRDEADEDVVL
jgi:hypothetical protein